MTYFPFIELRQDVAAMFIVERKYSFGTIMDKTLRLSSSELRDDEIVLTKAYWVWGSRKAMSLEDIP